MAVTSGAVGALVGLSLLLAASPLRRRAQTLCAEHVSSRRTRQFHLPFSGGTAVFGGRRAGRGEGEEALAAVLVEVAAVLRAGVAPAEAWRLVLGVPVPERVPAAAQLAVVAPAKGAPLDAVVAAARMADELGAPLAGVLEQVAAAIAARAEAAAEVEAALAGPRSSARVLAWLPLFGVLLGTALGADPLGALLGGGLGTAAGVAGVALLLVGRWWTGALLRRAGRAGGDP